MPDEWFETGDGRHPVAKNLLHAVALCPVIRIASRRMGLDRINLITADVGILHGLTDDGRDDVTRLGMGRHIKVIAERRSTQIMEILFCLCVAGRE